MTPDEPEFLGLGGRLGAPAGDELVEAGFALEIADAHLLHDGFALADLAHVLALADLGFLPDEDSAALLRALLEIGVGSTRGVSLRPGLRGPLELAGALARGAGGRPGGLADRRPAPAGGGPGRPADRHPVGGARCPHRPAQPGRDLPRPGPAPSGHADGRLHLSPAGPADDARLRAGRPPPGRPAKSDAGRERLQLGQPEPGRSRRDHRQLTAPRPGAASPPASGSTA